MNSAYSDQKYRVFKNRLYIPAEEGTHDWYLAWGPLYNYNLPGYASAIDEYMLMEVYIETDGTMVSLFKAFDESDKPKYLLLSDDEDNWQ